MRILQVSSAQEIGGGETHFLELVDRLRNRGHEVVVAGRRNSPLKPQIELPFINSADIFTAIRLRSTLKKRPFDILHAHVARDYTITAAAAWNLSKPKVVFTRHLLLPVQSACVVPAGRRMAGSDITDPEDARTAFPEALSSDPELGGHRKVRICASPLAPSRDDWFTRTDFSAQRPR